MESKSKCTDGEGIESQSLAAVMQKVSLKSKDGFVAGHVKLNVGGRFFCTTIDTLTKIDETMLSAMFSGRMEIPVDAEGRVFIDRSGKHFDTILNYLRDGDASMPTSGSEMGALLAEAKYYCIASLVAVCEKYLSGRDIPKMHVIVLLSSAEEWRRLLKTSSKPIVRLIVYPMSGDEIFKNTNLFNQIALEWNEIFLFVYDAVTSYERLVWEFYNSRGVQLWTVDCRRSGQSCFEGRVYEGLLKTIRILNNVFDR